MTASTSTRLADFPHALTSELAHWRRSTVLFLPLLGLAVASMQALLFIAAGTNHGWSSVLAWNVIWVTGLAIPAVGLFAGLAALRDRQAREGGIVWRPVKALTMGTARLCVLGVGVLLMNVLAVLPILIVGSATAPGPAPVGRVLATATVTSLGGIAILPILDLIARRFGLFASIGSALAWSIAGVITAENPNWQAFPFAWPIRAVLPLLGTHANGVAFTPGDAITSASTTLAILLTIALLATSALVFALLHRFTRTRNHRPPSRQELAPDAARRLPTSRTTPLVHTRPAPLWAALLALRRTAVLRLIVAAVFIELFTVLVWHRASYSAAVYELVLLPLCASLLPVLTWLSIQPAWRAIVTRPTRSGALTASLTSSLVIPLAGLAILSALIELAASATPTHALRALLLALTLGVALASLHLWLAIRFSPGLALGILALGMLTSLVTGGSSLANTLWIYGPWTWTSTASTSTLRTTIISLVGLAAAAALHPLINRTLRQRAANT